MLPLRQRKHPRFASLADNPDYIKSLLKDTSELQEIQTSRVATDMNQQVSAPLTVISMESLGPENIVELAEEQIADSSETNSLTLCCIFIYCITLRIDRCLGAGDAAAILYGQHEGFMSQADSMSRLGDQSQQPIIINGQQYTINIANGQAAIVPMVASKDEVEAGTCSSTITFTTLGGLSGSIISIIYIHT